MLNCYRQVATHLVEHFAINNLFAFAYLLYLFPITFPQLSRAIIQFTDETLIHSSMPSTRKQKAKERRSRQLDFMSDVENIDILLGNHSIDDDTNNQSEDELHLTSVSSRQ